jgi:hypothetical protein
LLSNKNSTVCPFVHPQRDIRCSDNKRSVVSTSSLQIGHTFNLWLGGGGTAVLQYYFY